MRSVRRNLENFFVKFLKEKNITRTSGAVIIYGHERRRHAGTRRHRRLARRALRGTSQTVPRVRCRDVARATRVTNDRATRGERARLVVSRCRPHAAEIRRTHRVTRRRRTDIAFRSAPLPRNDAGERDGSGRWPRTRPLHRSKGEYGGPPGLVYLALALGAPARAAIAARLFCEEQNRDARPHPGREEDPRRIADQGQPRLLVAGSPCFRRRAVASLCRRRGTFGSGENRKVAALRV